VLGDDQRAHRSPAEQIAREAGAVRKGAGIKPCTPRQSP
jgi:hypothetical protein